MFIGPGAAPDWAGQILDAGEPDDLLQAAQPQCVSLGMVLMQHCQDICTWPTVPPHAVLMMICEPNGSFKSPFLLQLPLHGHF